MHWHGLRLENRFDGTHQTQAPIPVGGELLVPHQFPDPGMYWYHPHIREDYGQEMGLYGTIVVDPDRPGLLAAGPPRARAHPRRHPARGRQGRPVQPVETTHAAMGRFGNLLLVSGEPDLALNAQAGEVVRLYLVNTANTRVFNVALPGARMKLVGGDSGRYEHEEFVDDVVLAPSERIVVDVLFDEPGRLTLEHRTPDRTYPLADDHRDRRPSGAVSGRAVRHPAHERRHERRARADGALPERRAGQDAGFHRRDGPADPRRGPAVYVCPMHPEVVSEEPAAARSAG